jgi:P-type E1-E2 ATPase
VVVHHNNLVVGDIVKIKAGMNIPVDGVIVKASGVQTNEAAMTGEADELKKDSLEVCLARKEEKEEELQMYASKDAKKKGNSHDLPSPIMLSGT